MVAEALQRLPHAAWANPIRLFPEGASTIAPQTDALFWTLVAICSAVGLGIAFFLIFFLIRYRTASKVNRDNPPMALLSLELLWIVIPLFIFMVIFLWSAGLYFIIQRPPQEDAMDIYVQGKQWMWKFQHPTGHREINELHVPVNQTVRLLMSSQDVIHSFFVPAFRVKQDAVPGRYTSTWFKATETGRYRLYCAEFCGKDHSRMTGWVYVMRPEEYAEWLRNQTPGETMAAVGERLFTQLGCSGCHRTNGRDAPVLEGLFGRPVLLSNGTRKVADYQYIRDSILLPQQDIVAGYGATMPTFAGILSEEDLLELVEYIRTLSAQPEGQGDEPAF